MLDLEKRMKELEQENLAMYSSILLCKSQHENLIKWFAELQLLAYNHFSAYKSLEKRLKAYWMQILT
jgi:hypothetical protein